MDMWMVRHIVKAGTDMEAVGRDVVGFRPKSLLCLHQVLKIASINLQPLLVVTIKAINEPPLGSVRKLFSGFSGLM